MTKVTATIVIVMARTVTDYVAALVYALLIPAVLLGGFYGSHALMGLGETLYNVLAGVILCLMPVVVGCLLSLMSRLTD